MLLLVNGYKVDDDIAYKIAKFEPCCFEMAEREFVNIDKDYRTSEYGVCFINNMSTGSFGEEWDWVEPYKISFCPFCGEKIEIQTLTVQDVTAKYAFTQKDEQCLLDKANASDSKKDEADYRKQAIELSEKLNWFLTSDGFPRAIK